MHGRLTRDALQSILTQNKYAGLVAIFLGARFQVANSGLARFKFSDAPGAAVWIDGQPLGGNSEVNTRLAAGTHTLVLRFDPKKLPEQVRIESADATFLAD